MSLQEEEEESLHSEAFEEEETNEASQPAPSDRPTINVSASRRPTHYHSLAKQYLQNNQRVLFVAMEAAILVSIDAALLLERNQIARIERVTTSMVTFEPSANRAEMESKARISISLERTGAFITWLEQEAGCPSE